MTRRKLTGNEKYALKVSKMTERELLDEVMTNPEHLYDSYYNVAGEALRLRYEELRKDQQPVEEGMDKYKLDLELKEWNTLIKSIQESMAGYLQLEEELKNSDNVVVPSVIDYIQDKYHQLSELYGKLVEIRGY